MVQRLQLCSALDLLAGLPLRGRMRCLNEFGIADLEVRAEDLRPNASENAVPENLDELLGGNSVRIAVLDVSSGSASWLESEARASEQEDQLTRYQPDVLVGDSGALDDRWDDVVAGVRRLGDLAARHGAVFCPQMQPGLCPNHHRLLKLVEDADHADVRLSFDTGVLHELNGPIEGEIAMARVCHRIGHVRLRDCSGAFGETLFPALGYGGAVNFIRIRELAVHSGFLGPFTIAFGHPDGQAETGSDSFSQQLKDSLRTLQHCGFLDPVQPFGFVQGSDESGS